MNFSVKFKTTSKEGTSESIIACCQNIPEEKKRIPKLLKCVTLIKSMIDAWNSISAGQDPSVATIQAGYYATISIFSDVNNCKLVPIASASFHRSPTVSLLEKWPRGLKDDRYIVNMDSKTIEGTKIFLDRIHSDLKAREILPGWFADGILQVPFNETEEFCDYMNQKKYVMKWKDGMNPGWTYVVRQ